MSTPSARDTTGAPPAVVVVIAWLWVLLPFAYGVDELVLKVTNLVG